MITIGEYIEWRQPEVALKLRQWVEKARILALSFRQWKRLMEERPLPERAEGYAFGVGTALSTCGDRSLGRVTEVEGWTRFWGIPKLHYVRGGKTLCGKYECDMLGEVIKPANPEWECCRICLRKVREGRVENGRPRESA